MSQVTVISGLDRRRVWTDEQKRALVAAACEPGASVAEVARRADLRPSQLYRWRRDLSEPVSQAFSAVTVSCEPEPAAAAGCAVVLEVGGAVLRIAADAPPGLVTAVIRSLRR
ncbi:IS66-like element accessory protein TnpA [Sphingomonas qomolangmaensis]|uniref:Transposase n=1 Tax=Sphingomonas qomolangmaensis TaxID=2918765 RepID=A0ABY5L624_9SPHN|nr:transposase [Sphingomonas qomolangmaensis]UUL82408.1 transposase [Sphingomonas qomolangmaensis]